MSDTLPEKHHHVKALVNLEAIAGCAKTDIKTVTRKIKFTESRKEDFLELLRTNANISVAARSVGVSPATINAHRLRYPDFNIACEEALEEAVDYMESEVIRRGFQGVKKKVYFKGSVVGEETVYSDTLAIRALEAHRPSKWSSKSNINIKQEIQIKDTEVRSKFLSMLGYSEDDIIEGEIIKD